MTDFRIIPFQPGLEEQILAMISHIQREEFSVAIKPEDQPDLQDIPGVYQVGTGNFWVAMDGEQVIGTIALFDIGDQLAALRKMFVHEEYRGKQFGVARRLLETLLAWAKQKGVKTIYLGTTPVFFAAHRFYEKNGFQEIKKEELPTSFPVLDVDTKFYRYLIEA